MVFGNVVLMHLPSSQLGCKSSSQIMQDHSTFNCEFKRYSRLLTGFLKPTSGRACAHYRLFVVKDVSGSAAIDYLLQSWPHWLIHRNQTAARTFSFCVHQKKPIRSDFYVLPICRPKHRDRSHNELRRSPIGAILTPREGRLQSAERAVPTRMITTPRTFFQP